MRNQRLLWCFILLLAFGCGVRISAGKRVTPVARVVDTTAWVTLWSDDFDDAELGTSWKPTLGRWLIEDGALKGVFARDSSASFPFYAADVLLQNQALPESVEIQFDTWSTAEIGSEAKFLNDDGTQGVIAALYGTAHPAIQSEGTVLFLMNGTNRFSTLAVDRQTALKPRSHQHVRIVRQPDGVTVFVDHKQTVSAAVPSQQPNLHLVGSFGKAGSVVFFDNLEIRTPATLKKRPK